MSSSAGGGFQFRNSAEMMIRALDAKSECVGGNKDLERIERGGNVYYSYDYVEIRINWNWIVECRMQYGISCSCRRPLSIGQTGSAVHGQKTDEATSQESTT